MTLPPFGRDQHADTPPAVSVIVNCRNGERYLRQALDSIFAQSDDDWEIIFWDNLSTDDSADIARAYGERVRYFRGGPFNLYTARNRAIERARGRYVGFLDTDDLWLPRKLELQRFRFERDQDVGLVYSNAEFFEDMGGRRLQWRRYRRPQPEGTVFRHLLAHSSLVFPTVMIRRSVFDACGGFDETMEAAGDTELFMRICWRSKAAYVHTVTALYRKHATNLSDRYLYKNVAAGDLIVQKFRAAQSDFDLNYGPEITAFILQRRKASVFGTWKNGDPVSARLQAWAYFRTLPAMMALFVASFLPFGVVHSLRKWNPFTRLRRERARRYASGFSKP